MCILVVHLTITHHPPEQGASKVMSTQLNKRCDDTLLTRQVTQPTNAAAEIFVENPSKQSLLATC